MCDIFYNEEFKKEKMKTEALYSRREFFAHQFVNKLTGAFMSFRRFGQKVRDRFVLHTQKTPFPPSGNPPERSGKLPEPSGTVPQAFGTIPETLGTVPEAPGTVPEAPGTVPRTFGNIPELAQVKTGGYPPF